MANHEVDQHADLDEQITDDAKGMKSVYWASLRILQWNADGIKSKYNELASRLQALDIDIAVVQESWLSSSDRTHSKLLRRQRRPQSKHQKRRPHLLHQEIHPIRQCRLYKQKGT